MSEEPPHREKLELSPLQIAASALAAVSAAVVCSYFGVAGTVVGTAVASAVATTASALYAQSVRITRRRVQDLQQTTLLRRRGGPAHAPIAATEVPGVSMPVPAPAPISAEAAADHWWTGWRERVPWPTVGVATLVVFVLSIGVITAVESALNKPLSSVVGGSAHSNRQTSLGGVLKSGPKKASPTPTPSRTSSPQPSTSPSPTATPSVTPSPTVAPTPTPVPRPTPTPLISRLP
jgi:hypothetical protein